jgi:hypothetical protein
MMAINREQRSAELDTFDNTRLFAPVLPKPILKPLNVHVARAAANALKVNVVNTNFEIRELVVAQGLQFHNNDVEGRIRFRGQTNPSELAFLNQFTIPRSLANDFPDIVIQDDNNAVFISDAQRVEFRIRVINTKDAFKTALETPGVHVIYCGHARWGRGPCFGPDLPVDLTNKTDGRDLTGDNWEMGTDPVKFGLFRMGHPFVGLPFLELDDHKYRMRPVPATVKVNPADIDKSLTNPSSLRPIDLRGTRFESFILDPVVDAYWGCTTVEGPGLLLFAGFENTPPLPPPFLSPPQPMDLGATDLQCRCFSVLGCETFDHFHSILRKRKGFTRTETEGFAYFTSDISNNRLWRLYIGSLFEFPERNDFKPWFPYLEFAVKRTNQKLAALREKFRLI